MEEIIFNETKPKINYLIFILCLIFVTIPIMFYKFENIKTIYGQVDEKYNIVINVDEKIIPLLNKIKINKKIENINIVDISKEFILDEKYNKYKVVKINQKLNKKNKVINNIIKIDLLLPKKNIIERIKKWN